jgi:hypothetical protein
MIHFDGDRDVLSEVLEHSCGMLSMIVVVDRGTLFSHSVQNPESYKVFTDCIFTDGLLRLPDNNDDSSLITICLTLLNVRVRAALVG